MEIASTNYLAEFVMEDPTFHEYPMDYFAYTLDEVELQSLSSGSPDPDQCYSSNPYFNSETETKPINCSPKDENLDHHHHHQFVAPPRPTKKLKTFETVPPPHKASSTTPPSSQLISFENSSYSSKKEFDNLSSEVIKKKPKLENGDNIDFAALISEGVYEDEILLDYDCRKYKAATTARNPVQAQEHVTAERKRREKLSQRFVALSTMVPGLKKMDKASILGDAIKHVKQLQERLQSLEEQATKKTVESAVLVKRSFIFVDDDENSYYSSDETNYSNNNNSHCDDQSLPEIQARVCGKEVLIRIHCHKKQNGREAAIILSKLEKRHLTVHTITSLPFGNDTLDITILAQMNEEYCMTAKELLRSLRLALTQFN